MDFTPYYLQIAVCISISISISIYYCCTLRRCPQSASLDTSSIGLSAGRGRRPERIEVHPCCLPYLTSPAQAATYRPILRSLSLCPPLLNQLPLDPHPPLPSPPLLKQLPSDPRPPLSSPTLLMQCLTPSPPTPSPPLLMQRFCNPLTPLPPLPRPSYAVPIRATHPSPTSGART